MTIYSRFQTVADRISVESLADMGIRWLNSKKWLENPSSNIVSGFNEQVIDAAIPTIVRIAGAYLVYPRISPLAGVFNGMIGIVYLGVGCAQRFRTLEPSPNTLEAWNAIALTIHKGFAHLLTAGYDFGIGYLLTRKYFDLASVAAFAVLPALACQWHQYVFKKTEAPDVESQAPSTPTAESAKTIPAYLAKTCLIYVIAKKITLELMPRKEQEPLLKKAYRTIRRVSGFGAEEPLPNYGL